MIIRLRFWITIMKLAFVLNLLLGSFAEDYLGKLNRSLFSCSVSHRKRTSHVTFSLYTFISDWNVWENSSPSLIIPVLTSHNSDWREVDRNKLIPYNLEYYPLYLKTTSKVGSGDTISVGLASTDHDGYFYTFIKLYLSIPPTVTMGNCNENESFTVTTSVWVRLVGRTVTDSVLRTDCLFASW